MSVTLTIKYGTLMYQNLANDWKSSKYSLVNIRSLPGVISIDPRFGVMDIEFDSEENRNWFVLRWS